MISEELRKAREFEATYAPRVPESERPVFHAAPAVGWMNDPNGFSFYRGEYHLFYQYHPYSTKWGPMHWGHLTSKDFVRWEHRPAVLAPDSEYDRDGCWSGGAVELPDGRQLLMYTGRRARGEREIYQTQCLAVGDGQNYEKYAGNPVLTAKDLPEGCSPFDFRDPKIWREPDGSYRVVTVTRAEDGSGAVLLFESRDGFTWAF
ncbi:MAG: glycoside hydrolase family 32 protein, partial [Oscillibacter sp.]|nr:glycoside hydrolase family 32 protein [Oscillibacter sp.]